MYSDEVEMWLDEGAANASCRSCYTKETIRSKHEYEI